MYMRLINCWCERSGFGTYVVPRAGKTIGKDPPAVRIVLPASLHVLLYCTRRLSVTVSQKSADTGERMKQCHENLLVG